MSTYFDVALVVLKWKRRWGWYRPVATEITWLYSWSQVSETQLHVRLLDQNETRMQGPKSPSCSCPFSRSLGIFGIYLWLNGPVKGKSKLCSLHFCDSTVGIEHNAHPKPNLSEGFFPVIWIHKSPWEVSCFFVLHVQGSESCGEPCPYNKLYTLVSPHFWNICFNSDWMKIPYAMGGGHPSSNLVRTKPAAMYRPLQKKYTLDHTFGYSSFKRPERMLPMTKWASYIFQIIKIQ